jgi:hypothetical protein
MPSTVHVSVTLLDGVQDRVARDLRRANAIFAPVPLTFAVVETRRLGAAQTKAILGAAGKLVVRGGLRAVTIDDGGMEIGWEDPDGSYTPQVKAAIGAWTKRRRIRLIYAKEFDYGRGPVAAKKGGLAYVPDTVAGTIRYDPVLFIDAAQHERAVRAGRGVVEHELGHALLGADHHSKRIDHLMFGGLGELGRTGDKLDPEEVGSIRRSWLLRGP